MSILERLVAEGQKNRDQQDQARRTDYFDRLRQALRKALLQDCLDGRESWGEGFDGIDIGGPVIGLCGTDVGKALVFRWRCPQCGAEISDIHAFSTRDDLATALVWAEKVWRSHSHA